MTLNNSIQKRYKDLFNVVCPIYNLQAPDNCNKDAYGVIQPISHNDISPKSRRMFRTSVDLKICTIETRTNNTDKSDRVVDAIMELIDQIGDFGDYQCSSTYLMRDITSNIVTKGDLVFLDRILTFEHKIKIKNI